MPMALEHLASNEGRRPSLLSPGRLWPRHRLGTLSFCKPCTGCTASTFTSQSCLTSPSLAPPFAEGIARNSSCTRFFSTQKRVESYVQVGVMTGPRTKRPHLNRNSCVLPSAIPADHSGYSGISSNSGARRKRP